MSNVERLKRAYEVFNETHEFDWDLLDPEVEWNTFTFAPTWEHRGHEGVRAWLEDVRGTFGELRIEPEEFVDGGDTVVVVSTMRGRGTSSGIETDQPLVSVWTFRDGKAVRHDSFQKRAEALEAAGLA
jgi:ketosteroid isomerase-like protein